MQLVKKELIEKKNWYGNPYKSIDECLKLNKLKIKDIDYVVSHGTAFKNLNNSIDFTGYKIKKKNILKSNISSKDKNFLINKLNFRLLKEKRAYIRNENNIKSLSKKLKKKIYLYDHHTCHASSAAFFQDGKIVMF